MKYDFFLSFSALPQATKMLSQLQSLGNLMFPCLYINLIWKSIQLPDKHPMSKITVNTRKIQICLALLTSCPKVIQSSMYFVLAGMPPSFKRSKPAHRKLFGDNLSSRYVVISLFVTVSFVILYSIHFDFRDCLQLTEQPSNIN